jgi:probable rRNA maturation factor
MARFAIEVVEDDGDWSAFAPFAPAIEAAARAIARRLGLDNIAAVTALSSDARVRALNRQFRGQDKPTNVLSFPQPGLPTHTGGPRALGDVVLAVETVRREAAHLGIAPVHHLQHLVVHGLLHLLGYDHATDAEAEAMEAIEIEVLAALGVANPYLGSEAAPAQPRAAGTRRAKR